MTDATDDYDDLTDDERRAAYSSQCRALQLRPWQSPPGWLDEDVRPAPGPDHVSNLRAWRLLRAMLALGISRYHPDPLAALAAAKRKQT